VYFFLPCNGTELVKCMHACIGELDEFDMSMASLPDAFLDIEYLGTLVITICICLKYFFLW